ncbi:hypothetical protein psal_cds_422 [Pandoravirus salinus]|uniref:Uncharacterized protein n=1 Tax=Pandoravirus salinus TaxID=1349410 RepID=A0A291ATG8_9VIRU|nr:Gag spuma superfamily incomplete domain [Pandoravirus salinus]ATE82173.1 hypothetical protein psal_cds_422 [Pandoravirus salinus]
MQDTREKQQQKKQDREAGSCAPEVSGFFDMATLHTVAVSGPDPARTPVEAAEPAPAADANPQRAPSGDSLPLVGDDVDGLEDACAVEVAAAHDNDASQTSAAAPSGYDIFARLRVWSAAGASAERSVIVEGEGAHNDGCDRTGATATAQGAHEAAQTLVLSDHRANAVDAEHANPPGPPRDLATPTIGTVSDADDTNGATSGLPPPPPADDPVGADIDHGNGGAVEDDACNPSDRHRDSASADADATLSPRASNKRTEEPVPLADNRIAPLVLDGISKDADSAFEEPGGRTPAGGIDRGEMRISPVAPVGMGPKLSSPPPPQTIPVHASSAPVPVATPLQASALRLPSSPPQEPRRWRPVAEAGWTTAALDRLDAHASRALASDTAPVHVVVFAHGAGDCVPASIERFGADALVWAVSSSPTARTLQRHGCAVVKWPARTGRSAESAPLSDLVTAVPWGRVNVVIDIGAERSPALCARTLGALLPRLARGAVYVCRADCHQGALGLMRSGIAKTVHYHPDAIIIEAPAS